LREKIFYLKIWFFKNHLWILFLYLMGMLGKFF
jgi:hypothetical protein